MRRGREDVAGLNEMMIWCLMARFNWGKQTMLNIVWQEPPDGHEVIPPRQEIFVSPALPHSLLIESGFVATLVSVQGAKRTCVGLLGEGSLLIGRDNADGLQWSYFALSEVTVRGLRPAAGLLSLAQLQAQNSLCVSQLALTAICNAQHIMAERCAQWLMRFARYIGPTVPVTHGFLAEAIGVRRSGVSSVLHRWQQEGLIGQGHGHITVLDPEGLRRKACSCPMIASAPGPATAASEQAGVIAASANENKKGTQS